MNEQTKYRLRDEVKVRKEKFGGLVYDHKDGKLQFIHSHLIMCFLENDGTYSVQEMAEKIAPGKIKGNAMEFIMKSLTDLHKGGVIYEV